MACKFCDFASGKSSVHATGYPFIALHKTRNTVSFLSQDIPEHENSHILVIPKKHYTKLEDLPKSLLHEIMDHVALAARVTKRTHKGCNILVNEGSCAQQFVPHVHVHIIPRDKHDRITIEKFKKKRMTIKQFLMMHEKVKAEFSTSKRK